jgi:hypothetical protein
MTAVELERLEDDGGPAPQPRDLRWTAEDARYDGEWWPRTDDAVAELTDLLPLIRRHTRHEVTRVTLHTSDWSVDHPRRVRIDGQLLRVGWFPHLPEHTVTIGCGADPRLVLHTHPSGSTPASSTGGHQD